MRTVNVLSDAKILLSSKTKNSGMISGLFKLVDDVVYGTFSLHIVHS